MSALTGQPQPTTPTAPRPHGTPPRGLATTPASSTTRGRFGRMFRHVPVWSQSAKDLVALGEAMVAELEGGKIDKPLGEVDDDENTATLDDGELRLPAGYTYFGQFVDHDITFDPVSSLTKQSDPDALTDYRTPRFDLDNVYGRGPSDEPFLYEHDGLHLTVGKPVSSTPDFEGPDLPRTETTKVALIGDPRNDENLVVSQLQSAILRLHNKVVDRVLADTAGSGLSHDDVFKLAQQEVRWHYQWVVVHDFLPRLVGQDVVDDILVTDEYRVPGGGTVESTVADLRYFDWNDDPFMPVEFSVAAYRYGHSMVRPSYAINDRIPLPVRGVTDADRIPIFSHDADPLHNLNGFRELPGEWGFQWKYFLSGIDDTAGPQDDHLPQPSYKIDHVLARPLSTLPDSVAGKETVVSGMPKALAQELAVRNLLRGMQLGIPCGEDVARCMAITPLTPEELYDADGDREAVAVPHAVRDRLAGHTPLWFYVLREAEVTANGAHLGPVGGRIVAEVLVGLLAGDPLSFLSVDPTWTPTLPSKEPDRFTLADLVNFAVHGA
ncbi:peroxidase family protein [Luteimicrobium subarcticum]|uniref:Heme peroxidase n=1 Tax=Luteimicrobium subarcticum TaxID=620910 RepID=A0A2M8W774_9MICO|nr:heme peroxidase family protein [Luteimicrobium subarcticum]PJI86759.1 heme peroxidase [Luteimicrobium subarcticum]